MRRNIFQTLTYYIGEKADPKENKVTEALATILDYDRGLLLYILNKIFGENLPVGLAGKELFVDTQIDYSDIQISDAPSKIDSKLHPTFVLFIENKINKNDTNFHLDEYAKKMKEFEQEYPDSVALLCVLAPSKNTFEQMSVKGVSWPDLFGWIEDYAHKSKEDLLINQFLEFLRIERLAPPFNGFSIYMKNYIVGNTDEEPPDFKKALLELYLSIRDEFRRRRPNEEWRSNKDKVVRLGDYLQFRTPLMDKNGVHYEITFERPGMRIRFDVEPGDKNRKNEIKRRALADKDLVQELEKAGFHKVKDPYAFFAKEIDTSIFEKKPREVVDFFVKEVTKLDGILGPRMDKILGDGG